MQPVYVLAVSLPDNVSAEVLRRDAATAGDEALQRSGIHAVANKVPALPWCHNVMPAWATTLPDAVCDCRCC